jgi:methionine sulfoxide reductase heme-binding subunit
MDLNTVLWIIGRATGMVGVILLSLAAAMGLALSMKASSPRFPRWLTTDLHRYVTILAVVVSVVHLVVLWLDSQSGLSALSLVIPFISAWDPVAVGIGVLGLEITLVVWLTTRLRDRMGYRLWQVIHRTASVGWVLVIAHGLMAGTDTRATWAIVTYAACAGMVMGLMVPRMVIGNRTGTRGAMASDARGAGSAHS